MQDTVDDEGESVLLGFGSDLSGGVSAGTPDETTLAITDDDPPEVSFGQSAYTVAEGDMVSVEVKLTSALGSAVTVPVTHTPQSATSSDDYSGVPANVMFSAGETSKAFTFTATQDTVDDGRRERPAHLRDAARHGADRNDDPDDGHHQRRRAGGEGDPGADAGDDQRERDGKCEHGYGERTVGVQRGHDGHGVGEPDRHHDADPGTRPFPSRRGTRTARGW